MLPSQGLRESNSTELVLMPKLYLIQLPGLSILSEARHNFESHGIPLLRVLTDRGSEYCGAEDSHEFDRLQIYPLNQQSFG